MCVWKQSTIKKTGGKREQKGQVPAVLSDDERRRRKEIRTAQEAAALARQQAEVERQRGRSFTY